MLLLLLLLPMFDEPGPRGIVLDHLVWYGTYLTNIFEAVKPNLRGDVLFVGHIWSLAVEEQFYLLWPAFVFLFSRKTLMWLCVAGISVALGLRIGFWAADVQAGLGYTLMPARMDALAAGALVALAVRNEAGRAALRRWAPLVALASLGIVAGYGFVNGGFSPLDDWVRTAGFTVLALLFASLVALTLELKAGGAVATLLSNPALRWLGRYSYAAYLIHLPAAVILSRKIDFSDVIPQMAGSTFVSEIAFAIVAAAITLSMAWLSWQVWESQFLRLKGRFSYQGDLETPVAESLS